MKTMQRFGICKSELWAQVSTGNDSFKVSKIIMGDKKQICCTKVASLPLQHAIGKKVRKRGGVVVTAFPESLKIHTASILSAQSVMPSLGCLAIQIAAKPSTPWEA